MAIYESLYFSYAGRPSTDFGIINVSVSSGMFEETFVASRTINETSIRGRGKPYFHGIDHEPIEFDLSFAFADKYDSRKIREVARWLMQDYYQPLYFSENEGRIFYCMPTGDSTLIHNGLNQGYLKIRMRCDSSYSYSPVYTEPTYDYSINGIDGTSFEFTNLGDVDCYPEIWIEKVGLGSISISNETLGTSFSFDELLDGETIYINNEREEVVTDLLNQYRFNDFNGKFLKTKLGTNIINVKGNCKITIRYQFKTLQG
jgi:phage-related protein